MNLMNRIESVAPLLFDEEGFLEAPEYWSRDLALGIAAELGVKELSEAHWLVVDKLRAQYLQSRRLPVQQTLCRELGLGPECIHTLFGGPLEAWRIAGLPFPGEEALTYMEGMESAELHAEH